MATINAAETTLMMHGIIDTLALAIVLLSALYLVSLAVVSFARPARASTYLLGFAGSALAHYVELGIRIIAGAAFVFRAPYMVFSDYFAVFGWILLVTTAGLMLVPWQWHQAFARRAVPYAVQRLTLVAASSLVAGGFIFYAALR
ncbi:MAG: hypothetical protein SH809_16920 [Rhodothermales bacterium]|nr:hypothetical protein [Rhodothermales bacterium]